MGKTTVAQLLLQEVAGSMLYDPEEVGFMLRAILRPVELSGDFQDYALWRPMVGEVAGKLMAAYRRPLILPMTIWRRDYFIEVMEGLRKVDAQVHHFCLVAPLDTVLARLNGRGSSSGEAWAAEQAPKCVASFADPIFETRIETAGVSPTVIAELIKSTIEGGKGDLL